jgi:hypothetical protein
MTPVISLPRGPGRRSGAVSAHPGPADRLPALRPQPQAIHRPAPEGLPLLIMPRVSPRTRQLCIHCRQSPAGFWVSQKTDRVRRPWCLGCCQELDRARCDVTSFAG